MEKALDDDLSPEAADAAAEAAADAIAKGMTPEDCDNYDEVREAIVAKLADLRDVPTRDATPRGEATLSRVEARRSLRARLPSLL